MTPQHLRSIAVRLEVSLPSREPWEAAFYEVHGDLSNEPDPQRGDWSAKRARYWALLADRAYLDAAEVLRPANWVLYVEPADGGVIARLVSNIFGFMHGARVRGVGAEEGQARAAAGLRAHAYYEENKR